MTKGRAPSRAPAGPGKANEAGNRRYAANREPKAAPSARGKLIGAIRAACRRKGMDDDDRRAVQLQLIGKTSMGDMTPGELGRLLDHLNRDWGDKAGGERSHIGKIRALWWSLYWIGAIDRVDDEALTTFVKRQTGIERLRFLDHMQAPAVIEALKSWLTREGVDWWTPEKIAHHEMIASCSIMPAQADRFAVASAIGHQLEKRGLSQSRGAAAWMEAWLGGNKPLWHFTAQELDATIREFGKKLRRAIEAERD